MANENVSGSLANQPIEYQIAEWKKRHGNVFKISVDGKEGYLKKPDRKTMAFALTKVNTDPLGYMETLLKNSWLGGDDEILKDDELFYAACAQMEHILEMKQAELVKL